MDTFDSNSGEKVSLEKPKVHVGRIGELTEEEIGDYFAKFGEVKEVVAKGFNGKAYAFVEFLDLNSAQRAFDTKEHTIGHQKVEVNTVRPTDRFSQRQHRGYVNVCNTNYYNAINGLSKNNIQNNHNNANDGLGNNAVNSNYSYGNDARSKKIFVGGLPSMITGEEFKSYFEQFGTLVDVVIMYDNETSRPRGFGFVTFDSPNAVNAVLQNNYHLLKNKIVEVKLAVPKHNNNHNNNGYYNGDGFSNQQGGFYPMPIPGFDPRYGLYSYPPHVPTSYYGLYSNYGAPDLRQIQVPYSNAYVFPANHNSMYGGYAGNGHDNGYAGNGHDNGYAGNGHDNGYASNGHVNGYAGNGHGHDNGYAGNGHVNGYAGNGHVNGYHSDGNAQMMEYNNETENVENDNLDDVPQH